MKLNEVIRKYRKEGNLTQEQIANYLGVTAPAVNKWENGISFPDISLLAPLARVLNIDMDTLFSFHEDLSDMEINQFIRELSELIQNDGYAGGFDQGESLLKEYPNCDILRLHVADILRAFLIMKEIPEPEPYEKKIIGWYQIVLKGKDNEIVDKAKASLVSYYMYKEDYEKAQRLLDEIKTSGYDRQLTQAILYEKQSRYEEAYKLYESMLFQQGNQMMGVLQLISRSLSIEKKYPEAEAYANLSGELAKLLDLGDYNAYTSSFLLAVEKKDKDQTIETLAHMLDGIDALQPYQSSRLYSHMKFKSASNQATVKEMLKNALKNNGELDFVKEDAKAKKLFRRLEE